ncbi:hypothetical protein QU38_00935, partial [Staphylococcus aureus]
PGLDHAAQAVWIERRPETGLRRQPGLAQRRGLCTTREPSGLARPSRDALRPVGCRAGAALSILPLHALSKPI